MAENHHDHGGIGKYVIVFFALCFLTGASFLTYFPVWKEFMGDAKSSARMFMMAVAVVKASLVMLFFMHLKWEANWKYVLTIPSMMMAGFLMIALVPDIGARMWRYSEERDQFAAQTESILERTAREKGISKEEVGALWMGEGHEESDGHAEEPEHGHEGGAKKSGH